MVKSVYIFIFLMGPVFIPGRMYAQEKEVEVEESTEVFLEEYSDEFQEKFFEALKQKGIENYDKAINLFLECKRIDPNSTVSDHELAKAYMVSNQLVLAEDYGILALISHPEDFWILKTLVDILQRQGATIASIKEKIPYNDLRLKENLASIYYTQEEYEKALKILNGMKTSIFSKGLVLKIKNSIQNRELNRSKKDTISLDPKRDNPLGDYTAIISDFIAKNNFVGAESTSREALESFPAQPYFYYVYGLALNKKGKSKGAIEILESGLDYVVDDVGLLNKMYKELVYANNALGNSSKANMYLSKIKSGS